jgi:hypothetical protein
MHVRTTAAEDTTIIHPTDWRGGSATIMMPGRDITLPAERLLAVAVAVCGADVREAISDLALILPKLPKHLLPAATRAQERLRALSEGRLLSVELGR